MHFLANILLLNLIGSLETFQRGRSTIIRCINGENLDSKLVQNISVAKDILMLPASTNINGEINRQITLGETVSLEELGPIIINADGTTRRITNWLDLNKVEQETSWRVISARNLKRLKALQKKIQKEPSDSIEAGPENPQEKNEDDT